MSSRLNRLARLLSREINRERRTTESLSIVPQRKTKPLSFERLESRLVLDASSQALELFATSPALFVENQGQWSDDSIRFVHSGSGANIGMTESGIQFQLFRSESGEEADEVDPSSDPLLRLNDPDRFANMETTFVEFSASFVGAHVKVPRGADQSTSVFHYLTGEPSTHRSDVPSFEKIVYEDLYDGIDLVTWGQRSSLKYEFQVAPGADYSKVLVHYNGIDGLSITGDGSLSIDLGEGWAPVVDDAPFVYQIIEGQQVEIESHFVLIDSMTYGFELVGSFDPSRKVIIDPELEWSAYFGGSSYDVARDIDVDVEGNVFVTGDTTSSGWVSGGFDTSFNGSNDAFVVKISGSGSHLWSTYLGGSGGESSARIAIDADGNPYVTGYTNSPGWVSGGFDTSFNGVNDGFVAKLSASGTRLWSTYVGGSDYDGGFDIAVDATGNALLTGYTLSSGWVSGGFDTSFNGSNDAFVVKISPIGTHLWSTYLGGGSNENGRGIDVDEQGNVFVTGETTSSGWVFGGFDTSFNGGVDAFVVKLSSAGNHLWSTYLGGDIYDFGYSIAVDAPGNLFVTGETTSSGWVSGGFDTSFNGSNDAFVVKISGSGSHLWSTYLGGVIGSSIVVDAAGNALATGNTTSSGWVSGGFDTSFNGSNDAFVVKISPIGTHLWSTYLGGDDYDTGSGIAIDAAGNIFVTGRTDSSSWISVGTYHGNGDIFIAKISDAATLQDVPDSLAGSRDLGVIAAGTPASFTSRIGDGPFGSKDIDLFRFVLASSTQVTITVDAPTPALNGYLRLFAATGIPITSNDNRYLNNVDPRVVIVLTPGAYYVGVSGAPNRSYDPNAPGSGVPSTTTGSYELHISASAPGDNSIASELATIRQNVSLERVAFDGSGEDILVTILGAAINETVELFAGTDGGSRVSLGTFVNVSGASPWEISIDLAAKSILWVDELYVVGQSALSFGSPVVRYTSPAEIDLYEEVTASPSNIGSFIDTSYENVAKVFVWNWDTKSYVRLTDENLGRLFEGDKKSIILTHGWDDRLNMEDLGSDNRDTDEYMINFAFDFMRGRSRNELNSYQILAIDWWDEGSSKGSDPDFLDGAREWVNLVDAQLSAINGYRASIPLARKFLNADADPSKLFLIGHSNGAGFMAGLASTLFQNDPQSRKIPQLVALDAPFATYSYWSVREAAFAIERIENYFIPFAQKGFSDVGEGFVDVYFDGLPDVSLGFGAPMLFVPNITNFELDEDISSDLVNAISHSQVPLRYSKTAHRGGADVPWGFRTSTFVDSKPLHSEWIWREVHQPGTFVQYNDPIKMGVEVFNATVDTAKYAGQQIKDSAVSIWDETVRIGGELSESLRGVNTSILAPFGHSAPFPVHLLFEAQSPAFGAIDVHVPDDTIFLSFDIVVTDPGNEDVLKIAFGEEIIGEISLAAVHAVGARRVELIVAAFAGQEGTLSFYMPSDEPSSAEFVLSNTEFLIVDRPALAISAPAVTVRGHVESFEITTRDITPLAENLYFYAIDWNNDGVFDQYTLGSSVHRIDHIFNVLGTHNYRVAVLDANGIVVEEALGSIDVVSYRMRPSDDDDGLLDLFWGGTDDADSLVFAQTNEGILQVTAEISDGELTPVVRSYADVVGRIFVFSGPGNDLIDASGLSTLAVVVDGGGGNDTILGGPLDDAIDADGAEGTGNDVIDGGDGDDVIYADGPEGYDPTDTLGTDTVEGGDGDDLIYGDGAEGSNDDFIQGGSGSDMIYADGAEGIRERGTYGNDTVRGGDGDDLIVGDGAEGANDDIEGEAGDDILIGGGGSDLLHGGNGSDLVLSGPLVGIDFVAVQLIRAEWLASRPLPVRVNNLLGNGEDERLNDDAFLTPDQTVLDDLSIDNVLGGDDEDWLLANTETDILEDLDPTIDIVMPV